MDKKILIAVVAIAIIAIAAVGAYALLSNGGGGSEKYALSISSENTSFTVNGGESRTDFTGDFKEGESITIVSVPNQGYEFTGYYKGSTLLSSNSTYTFKMGASGILIKSVASPETIPVIGITLDKESAEVDAGSTTTIKATVLPTNATNKGIVWSSSDASIAKVDNGVVTGVLKGEATITATTVDGGKTASCKVTVKEVAPVGSVRVSVNAILEGEVSSDYGSVSIDGTAVGTSYSAYYLPGTVIKLSANPAAGYRFDRWVMGGTSYEGKPMSLTVGNSDLDVTAVFAPSPSHVLSVSIDNGTVAIDGASVSSKNVKEGMTATITATPAEGYKFIAWYLNGNAVSTSPQYVVTMGMEDRSYVAKTSNSIFAASISANDGTVIVNGENKGQVYSGAIAEGSTIVFEAVPDIGYEFERWVMNGATYNSSKITVTNVNGDINAVAYMSKVPPRTIVAYADAGTVTANGSDPAKSFSGSFEQGETVTLVVEPSYGHKFRGWMEGDKVVSISETYEFVVTGDRTVRAVVESTLRTLNVTAVNGGLIIDNFNIGSTYSTRLYEGESLTVNAAPSSGNTFSEWDLNGKKYGQSYQSIKITMGSEDIEAVAYCSPMDDATLHITATNGTVKVGEDNVGDSKDIIAPLGQKYKLTAIPSAGYHFDHWVIDGEISNYQIVEITMGTEHVNAEAIMVKNESHTVKVSIDNGNLIYKGANVGSSLTVTVDDKDTIKIYAQPVTGYALAGWYEDGISEPIWFGTEYEFQVIKDVTLRMDTLKL
ncbi:MAG: Ig domain-containing protein [Candidatus Methanomethylophilaceae archaeon]|nr:Ig domain-containing protein [Candidatus Methanomethylophilaceae archaeon]